MAERTTCVRSPRRDCAAPALACVANALSDSNDSPSFRGQNPPICKSHRLSDPARAPARSASVARSENTDSVTPASDPDSDRGHRQGLAGVSDDLTRRRESQGARGGRRRRALGQDALGPSCNAERLLPTAHVHRDVLVGESLARDERELLAGINGREETKAGVVVEHTDPPALFRRAAPPG